VSKRRKERKLTHLDRRGAARMVDVSAKPATRRVAVAQADVNMSGQTWRALASGNLPKGDALAVARLAGIAAAKRTSELIPLCHPLPMDFVSVDVEMPTTGTVRVTARVGVRARTGVEMEAMMAVCVAALAVYDMCKGLERGIRIGPVRLLEKSGGRSGRWTHAG